MVNRKKLLAILLIFTLTFSYFATVTEAIATTNFVSLFSSNSSTGHENVKFDATFVNGEKTSKEMVSDVNNDELAIKMNLDVETSGYLKDAKVELKTKDEEDLNFAIEEENEVTKSKVVQSLEDNILEFNKIDSSSDEIEVLIPIKYIQEKYISKEKLNNNAIVSLSGTYIDKAGKEHEISKEIELTLAWEDNRTVKVESEVSKYIKLGDNSIVLQTIVKVDTSCENENSLPTKKSELNIDVPKIDDKLPTEVDIIANSTLATNGKNMGDVDFSKDNWKYNQEEGKVYIELENKEQLVKMESVEYLKEEETKQENRYYSDTGIDEYVITYTFQDINITDEMPIAPEVQVKLSIFSGVKAQDNETISTAEKIDNWILSGQTGNIVSYDVENETEEVSKVYGYLNKEVEFDSKTSINISYADIVEEIILEDTENNYIDKLGNKISTGDIYYKQIEINKENYQYILGEEGYIQILDISGNLLTTINNETEANEDGNFELLFGEKISKLIIKTSAPVNVGNLIIFNKKAISDISVSKDDYSKLEYISTETVQKVKFTYVSDFIETGTNILSTKLKDTTTNFNLKLDKKNLSTVTTNSNIEMRLELCNNETISDIYGNSIFEIEMPENITNLNITNTSMINGEGLEISNVETYMKDGKNIARINVTGNQTDINSGVLTNGANIVLNADITVDKYAPSKKEAIKAYCYNSEATNYTNKANYTIETENEVAYQEYDIKYSSPSGVVAINTLSNYNNEGKILTSIKQGKQIDYLDIYSEAKTATMEIVVINNNDNDISNLKILGRIPFEGVKDLETGEDLGTTLDVKMVSEITSNMSGFTVYYSENKEATANLNEPNNAWIVNPQNLENMKSYLIVPNDGDYKLEAKQVLKFTYGYEVPSNLTHNKDIYGTFIVSYTNNTENGDLTETSKPDLIGLTTGAGAELELTLKTDQTSARSNDKINLTATIENTGKDVARNVIANIPIPENMTFITTQSNNDSAKLEYRDNNVIVSIDELSADTSIDIDIEMRVNILYSTDIVQVSARATARDLDAEITSNQIEIELKALEMNIEQFIDSEIEDDFFYKKDDEINVVVFVENLSEKPQENVTVATKLTDGLRFSEAYMVGRDDLGTYNSNTNEITWKIGTLNADEGQALKLVVKIGDLEEGTTASTETIKTKVTSNFVQDCEASDININIGKSSISITQTSSTSTYVSEGEKIEYSFNIKNEGMKLAKDIVLTDIIPDGLIVKKIEYVSNGIEAIKDVSETGRTDVTLTIPANDEVNVKITALAYNMGGSQEKTVTNVATLSNVGAGEIESNSVTHIVQALENPITEENMAVKDNTYSNNNTTTVSQKNLTNTDITKSYKITGTAWLDKNENGMKEDSEQRMSGIEAMLVDSTTGVIKSTITTNDKGEYAFTGIQNGSYLIIFKYNTILYTTTTYRKEGIESSINSDVVTTKIEQNGKKENGAVTDVINVNGANVTNIDIGLIEAAQFSLDLDKAITKITVQNAQGTATEELDKVKLAQYGITAKYLVGTTVYVEYEITVTNNGDLSGFASEIVDYIPKGMTFNSKLNADWYTGTDGNLYTKSLANTELVPGQSKTIKLVLTKQMTTENTEIVSNTAEIADDYNVYGVSDKNSVPSNKAQSEDDISTADIILTVKTGESLIYVSAIIVSIIVGGAVAFIVYERLIKDKKKGGV